LEYFDIIELPIDGILDLHAFRPGEVKELVVEYLAECRKKGILTVRIIHGKGTGQLRRAVASVVGTSDGVSSFRPAGEEEGGWGATIVELRPE
jgi:DNA-nicking Smr family endonuclease